MNFSDFTGHIPPITLMLMINACFTTILTYTTLVNEGNLILSPILIFKEH